MSRQLPARRGATSSSDGVELAAGRPSEPDIDLGHVNRGVLWSRLALTQTQLAQLAGLSQRQISRWAAHGLLPPSSGVPGRYNGEDVERVILMQRAIARGYRPRRAAQLASMALARQAGREDFAPPSEIAARELLVHVEQSLATLREMLFSDRTGRGERG
jgi:DNA-binding transcriptional MerR regulator